MTKKTRLIAFDYEKYKAGAKAVCKNSDFKILHIQKCPKKLIAILEYKDINPYTFQLDGKYTYGADNEWDLYLEEQLEERTFYVNVYGKSENYTRTIHHSEVHADLNNCGRDGKLKITYTDEDLIR